MASLSLLTPGPFSIALPTSTSHPSTTTTTSTSTSTSSRISTSTSTTTSSTTSASSSTTLSTTSSSTTTSLPSSTTSPSSAASSTPTVSVADSQTQQSSSATVYLSSSTLFVTPTPAPSPATTPAPSSGFLRNTGAVAGTFSIVGLVCLAAVIAAVLFIARRRHSRAYAEDTEYLDKTPDFSVDPHMTQITSDDGFTSDHGHYAAPPLPLASPPAAYYLYPDPLGYPPPHAQPHAIYSQNDFSYPSRLPTDMPNPHEVAGVQPDSPPVPPSNSALPNVLRPSVMVTGATPRQWANARLSVDSFYAGIAPDTQHASSHAF